jgi:hypothetical protein
MKSYKSDISNQNGMTFAGQKSKNDLPKSRILHNIKMLNDELNIKLIVLTQQKLLHIRVLPKAMSQRCILPSTF